MRTSSIELTRTCPQCGGLGHSEAKLPMSANRKTPVFNLDDMAGLVGGQGLSLLLALIELLPYKLFTCSRCQAEFKMASQSTKELVQAILMSMRPVIPDTKPARRAAPIPRQARPADTMAEAPKPRPRKPSETQPDRQTNQASWEAESLDSLFDYRVEDVAEDPPPASV